MEENPDCRQLLTRLKELPDEATLKAFLEQLPDEREMDFELLLTELIRQVPQVNLLLENVVRKGEAGENVLFGAFYGLQIYYRRVKDFHKIKSLIEMYGDGFHHHPLYDHLLSLYYRFKSKVTKRDLREAYLLAHRAVVNLPNHSGILHSFAEAVALLHEEGVRLDDRVMKKAMDAVERAICLNRDYPKYYCTRGRLLAARGDFKNAEESVQEAIDREDSGSFNYQLRIMDYQQVLNRIRMDEAKQSIARALDEALKEIRDYEKESRLRSLELLGLFATLVTFALGSIQIAVRQNFASAAKLIVILSGSLLCVYGGFAVTLHGRFSWKKHLFVILLGMGLIIGSLFLFGGWISL